MPHFNNTPAGYEPTNRELFQQNSDLINAVQKIQLNMDQTAKDVEKIRDLLGTVNAILFGDRSRGIDRGMIERMASVEQQAQKIEPMAKTVAELDAKEEERTKRETERAAQIRLLTWLAGFFGVTNAAGLAALIAYLFGIIHP